MTDTSDPDNTSEPGDEPAVEPMEPNEPTLITPDDADALRRTEGGDASADQSKK